MHATQKELNVATINNKQVFLRHSADARKTWRIDGSYTYRPDQFKRTTIRLSYINERIADTILKVQKNYYPGQTNRQAALDVSYRYQYIKLSNIVYPTSGYYTDLFFLQRFASKVQSISSFSARQLYAKKLSAILSEHVCEKIDHKNAHLAILLVCTYWKGCRCTRTCTVLVERDCLI